MQKGRKMRKQFNMWLFLIFKPSKAKTQIIMWRDRNYKHLKNHSLTREAKSRGHNTQNREAEDWLFSNLKTKLFIRFIKMLGYVTLQCFHFKAFWSFGWSRFVERRDTENRLLGGGEEMLNVIFKSIYIQKLTVLSVRGDKNIYFVYKQPCSCSFKFTV